MRTPTRPRRLTADHFRALASSGLRTPIGTDLVLHERPDPEAVRLDGRRLAGVVREAAERYRTPLAIPLMDLRLEKADLVRRLRPDLAELDRFHFDAPPSDADLARARDGDGAAFLPAHRAQLDAIAEVAARPGLTPFGMAIGPFSLATKLVTDPIAPVALAGRGVLGEDEPLVATVERSLLLAERAVHRSLRAQLEAGAAAVIVCEPAASAFFVSPRQMAHGSPVFGRFVLEPLVRLKALLDDAYSDETLPMDAVRSMTRDLVARMRETAHPFILGSECDVLHVPGAAETIRRKVEAMLSEAA